VTSDGRLADPLQEAIRLIAIADAAGVQLRLMGGLAFHAKAPTWTARIDREGRDIDLATRSKDKRAVQDLLVAEGYVPDKAYNAIHGYKQLYFVDPDRRRPVDVLIDRLEMCHVVEFGRRLQVDHPTLPLAELLLTKLQIVKINRKDVLDALVLLAGHPLTLGDRDGINVRLIADLTAGDWGWWRTMTQNLAKLRAFYAEELQPGELDLGHPLTFDPASQIDALSTAIETRPKSARWRLRSRIGDRMTWYREPEEVGH
jgi:hypothetical protein